MNWLTRTVVSLAERLARREGRSVLVLDDAQFAQWRWVRETFCEAKYSDPRVPKGITHRIGSIGKETRAYVDRRSGGICEFGGTGASRCRRRAVDIHHVVFRSRGGTNEIENLRAACAVCHAATHRVHVAKNEKWRGSVADEIARKIKWK